MEIREYLSIEQVQILEKQGAKPEFTGWQETSITEILYEVRYLTVKEELKVHTHTCRIFDIVKTGDEKYQCQSCGKAYNQESFNILRSAAPEKFCSCGGNTKKMALHIPHPVSGYENSPIFYACNSCGSTYMFYRCHCQNECCGNTCDRSEVYCISCQKLIDKA